MFADIIVDIKHEKLEAEYEILPVKMLERQISKIDATNKLSLIHI